MKIQIIAGKFARGVKAKHCWALSTKFWKRKNIGVNWSLEDWKPIFYFLLISDHKLVVSFSRFGEIRASPGDEGLMEDFTGTEFFKTIFFFLFLGSFRHLKGRVKGQTISKAIHGFLVQFSVRFLGELRTTYRSVNRGSKF